MSKPFFIEKNLKKIKTALRHYCYSVSTEWSLFNPTIMKILFALLLLGVFFIPNTLKAQTTTFFDQANDFFAIYAQHNAVKYQELYQRPEALEGLIKTMETTALAGKSVQEQKAFYINAYNLLVIAKVVEHYPIASPNEVLDFWDGRTHQVAGKDYTLEALEAYILTTFEDPRLHFALSNGTVACAPIANFAYRPAQLEEQLRQRVIGAVNNSQWIQYRPNLHQIQLPMLFDRYAASFEPTVLDYLNTYRVEKVATDAHILYTNEDWTLNSYQATPSVLRKKKQRLEKEGQSKKQSTGSYAGLAQVITLPKGVAEFIDFNSIYTIGTGSRDNGSRTSYFASYFTAFYGVTGKLDIGMCLLFRSTRERDYFNSSPFNVLKMERTSISQPKGRPSDMSADFGLSHMGFQARFAPFKNLNLSFEHGFMLPIRNMPDDNTVDQNIYSVTQVYYIHPLSPKWQLFFALTYWQGFRFGEAFRPQVPLLRGFLNHFATPRLCVYATSMFLLEWGVGVKYLLTPKFELQVLYSYFIPIPGIYDIFVPGSTSVMTYNLGLRYRL